MEGKKKSVEIKQGRFLPDKHKLRPPHKWTHGQPTGEIDMKVKLMKEELTNTSNTRHLALVPLADKIFSKGMKYLAAASNITFVPWGNPAIPELFLCGRSLVGKTTLLRALMKNRYPIYQSNTLYRREVINYFNVGNVFNIAAAPGMHSNNVSWPAFLQHAVLLRNFVRCRPNLKMMYYCMDVHSKCGMQVSDIDMLKFLAEETPNFTVVVTKTDLLKKGLSSKFTLFDVRKELAFHGIQHPVIGTSSVTLGGLDTLRFDMVQNALHTIPTDRLTYVEATRLGSRLLTKNELATVQEIPQLPREGSELLSEWKQELIEESTARGNPSAKEDANSLQLSDNDEKRRKAFSSLSQKMKSHDYLKYVHQTSPWRNPQYWPPNVVPTRDSRKNIMRVPQDASNPYLLQPLFVAPRADMNFRKLNIAMQRAPQKGIYTSLGSSQMLSKQFTIPYFPGIIDVTMNPQPWAFVGSVEGYHERDGGKVLGIASKQQAMDSVLNPLLLENMPKDLGKEVQKLEERRYVGLPSESHVPQLTAGGLFDLLETTPATNPL